LKSFPGVFERSVHFVWEIHVFTVSGFDVGVSHVLLRNLVWILLEVILLILFFAFFLAAYFFVI
jgi:hypothetical protein